MVKKSGGVNLSPYWPFWGLHFGIHLVIGLAASSAGLVVIFTQGEVINGLALMGAGSFAIVNGWQGCKELIRCKVKNGCTTSKENNQ